MPTRLPRHAITETPAVSAAINSLRAISGEKVSLAELVILGAQTKAALIQATNQEASEALDDLADMVASGSLPVDPDAAERARLSWVHAG